MEQFYYSIEESAVDQRVDRFLFDKLTNISRSQIQRLIDENHLLVNGKKVKASYRLRLEDEVAFELSEKEELKVEAQDLPLDIIYEDEDLAVINKPVGMVVHPAPGNETGTLVNALLFHFKDLSSVNGEIRRGIVHRIDKDTSGILVVAKNDRAHEALSLQLQDHSMKREYVALCEGIIKEDEGTINAPIARDPRHRLRMGIVRGGREAISHFKVQHRYEETTLVRVRLETGRTHQIRVHMASIHHPVVSDPVYGYKKQKIEYSGQLLHARVLGFNHPKDGKYMEFSCPVPEKFRFILEKLAKRKEGLEK